ncbi:MAG: nucleoside hydrolase [Actinomycetota bacterium]
MMKRPVVLDCYPGHDDVVAILLAHRFTDLRAVTTVSGNAPLDRTTHNALVALSLLGADVPVSPGASRPLVVEPYHFPQIHGDSGLAGPDLPDPRRGPETMNAVECLLAESRTTDGLWIVATGPLTNVALALRADPALGRRLGGISIMGGGLDFGNVTPGAEYNIWADPEAAAVVFESGVPLVMCPLDVTHRVLVGAEFIARVAAAGTALARFMADLFGHFAEAYAEVFFEDALGPLHDPCAVLALTHPELFEFREFAIEVLTGGAGRGMTVADRRGVKGARRPNASVAVGVKASDILDIVADSIVVLG